MIKILKTFVVGVIFTLLAVALVLLIKKWGDTVGPYIAMSLIVILGLQAIYCVGDIILKSYEENKCERTNSKAD